MRIQGVKYKMRLIRQVQYIARVFGFYWAGRALVRFRIPARHALDMLKEVRSMNRIKRPVWQVPEQTDFNAYPHRS